MLDPVEPSNRYRFLVRDLDAKYTGMFDAVFHADGVEVLPTPDRRPGRKPSRNAGCEWYGGNAWRGILIYNTRHLLAVLRGYLAHYNAHGPQPWPRATVSERGAP